MAKSELFYEYRGRFGYEEFLDRVAPLIPDYIEVPESDIDEESVCAVVVQSADYLPECREALERLRLKDLDGKRGFVAYRTLSYIEHICRTRDHDTYNYERVPIDVDLEIIVLPFGMDEEDPSLTPIY